MQNAAADLAAKALEEAVGRMNRILQAEEQKNYKKHLQGEKVETARTKDISCSASCSSDRVVLVRLPRPGKEALPNGA